jgi:GAF domain-containing protein
VILPIGAGPRVVGVLNLTEKPGGDIYTLDDLELLNLLLDTASLALDNALLRNKGIQAPDGNLENPPTS